MHSQKMLHLDIKPKNIMRKADGRDYLIDFGLSKQFTDDGEPESSTSIGLGTPGYSPIEQSGYKQDGTFPATLDVYALGATMFKMLMGKRPPEATIILNEGFPDEQFSNAAVSKETVYALKKAMEPIKKNRYQTVSDFLSQLKVKAQINTESEDATVIEDIHDNSDNIKDSHESKTICPPIITQHTAPQNTPIPPSINNTSEIIDTSSNEKSSKKYGWYIFGCIITALIVILGYYIFTDNSTQMNEKEEFPENVTEMEWTSPLGECLYTGRVEPVTIRDHTDLIPHGKGVAVITSGDFAGCTYDGEFVWGKMDGQTTYTTNIGDIFEGKFKTNQYSEGRYTINSTGEYFEGSFKDGLPDKGNWYNKEGKKL